MNHALSFQLTSIKQKAGMNHALSFQLTSIKLESWNESRPFIPAYDNKIKKLE